MKSTTVTIWASVRLKTEHVFIKGKAKQWLIVVTICQLSHSLDMTKRCEEKLTIQIFWSYTEQPEGFHINNI